uniref:Vacuolar protein sorting-associated protein 30 n=1 Tax=Lygus hesperus TaxID=30085 RepID=A0A0A9YC53_LYGHE
MQLCETQHSMETELENVENMVQYLQHCNPILDLFPITFTAHIGTIGGFRLGRTATQVVEWDEINIALGQLALLLDMIQKRSRVQTTIHILSRGALSEIRQLNQHQHDTSTIYPLYRLESCVLQTMRRSVQFLGAVNCHSSETRTVVVDEFDYAILLLATLIETLATTLKCSDNPSWTSLHYQFLGQYSLIYDSQQELDWTLAMAHLLTNSQLLLLCLV